MKSRSLFYAFAVFLSLSASAVLGAQAGPIKGKLGYGFEPGLTAGKDFVAGQLIVGLKDGMSINGLAQAAAGGKVVKEIAGTAVLLAFDSEGAAQAAVGTLIRRPEVAFVERNGFMSIPPQPARPNLKGGRRSSPARGAEVLTVSSDPGTGYQWHHMVIRKTATLTPPALSATPPTIAVIDTGVDYTHPDLVGKVIVGRNLVANNFDPFDDNGHGTHVAGLAAAAAANGDYGEGVCPNCKILAVKVLGATGSGTFFDVANGMHFAHSASTVPPVRVLNMSLGGPFSLLVETEVDHIEIAGEVLVASAGNENSSTFPTFPGADPDVALRVMATEENDCRTFFSNFSPSDNPDLYNIAAPGFAIPSTLPGAGFGALSGTSMSSPIVAGAAALVWGQQPSLSRLQLIDRIVNNGKSINCGFDVATRRLDVRKAILGTAETAIVGRILDPFSGKAPSPLTIPTNARLFLGLSQLAADTTNVGGSYEMTGLAAGLGRILRGDRVPSYVDAQLKTGIPILAGLVAGPYTDALPKARAAGNCTITVDWKTTQPQTDTLGCVDDCNGWEFDLLVRLPSGIYIDPFFDPGNLVGPPFVTNPRDSFDDSQPLETIVIGNAAAPGVYKVVVDKFPFGPTFFNPSWTNSQASVQFYNGETSTGPFFAAPPASCTAQEYWHVANITKSATTCTVASVNTCTSVKPGS